MNSRKINSRLILNDSPRDRCPSWVWVLEKVLLNQTYAILYSLFFDNTNNIIIKATYVLSGELDYYNAFMMLVTGWPINYYCYYYSILIHFDH